MRHVLSTMAAIVIAAQVASAETASIKAASVDAEPGGSAAVAIDVSGARGFRAMHVEVEYDATVLSAQTVDAGPLLQGALFEADVQTPGLVLLKIAAGDVLGGDGNLATIHFKVLGKGAATSELVVKNCRVYAPGEGGELIAIQSVPGRIRIKGGISLLIWISGGALLLLFGMLAGRRGRAKWRARPAVAGPCAKCGTALAAGAKFCQKCGNADRRGRCVDSGDSGDPGEPPRRTRASD